MGHGLHQAEVTVERMLHELLTVSGRGHTGYFQFRVGAIDIHHGVPDQRDRIAVVRVIPGMEQIAVPVYDDKFDGCGTRIDADMHRPDIVMEFNPRH